MLKKIAFLIVATSLFLSVNSWANIPTHAIPSAQTPTQVSTKTKVLAEKVNINKANVAELQNLPRVGAKLAQRIVDYRQQHGTFKTVEELTQVKGISDKMLAKMKNQIVLAS